MLGELYDALKDCADCLLNYDGLASDPEKVEGWSDNESFKSYTRASAILAKCRQKGE